MIDLQDGRHRFTADRKPKSGYLRPVTDKAHIDPIFGFKNNSKKSSSHAPAEQTAAAIEPVGKGFT
jgi:hypothetical protein